MGLNLTNKNNKDLIVKSNEFIQKARYNLSIGEIKIISLLIATIDKEDMDFRTHSFEYKYFTSQVGYEKKPLEYIKNLLRKLKRQQYEIDYIDDNGDEVWELFGFIDSAKITKDKTVELKFNEDMRGYLLELKNNFTVYELTQILEFDSAYTFRMYEILKVKYEQFKKYKRGQNLLIETTIEDLKKFLGIEDKYKRYFDFKRKVLEVARKELEEKANIHLEYFEIKEGKKVVGLRIYPKPSEEEEAQQDYYDFINNLRTRCANKMIIWDRKKDLQFSVSKEGRLYFMNSEREIDKNGAEKMYRWLYENQQYISTECKELLGINEEYKNISVPSID